MAEIDSLELLCIDSLLTLVSLEALCRFLPNPALHILQENPRLALPQVSQPAPTGHAKLRVAVLRSQAAGTRDTRSHHLSCTWDGTLMLLGAFRCVVDHSSI